MTTGHRTPVDARPSGRVPEVRDRGAATVPGQRRRRAGGPVLALVADRRREHRDPAVGVRAGLLVVRGAGRCTGHRLRLSRPARWGRRLGGRTGEVLARRRVRARPWPETHLAQTAEVVAAMAAAVALVFVYWAAGGSFGLSSSHPHRSLGLQASRVAGAVAAAVGLPGLAGRWGSQRRFWLPVALTWLGSGALVAFDGLNLALNRLFGMFGTDASVPGWSVIDTALVIKWGSGCWPRLWVPSRSQPPPGTARHQLRKGSHTLVQLLAVVSGRRRLSCRRSRRPRSWSGIDDHSRFVVSARVWWPLQRRRARRVSQHAGDPPWVRCAPCAGGSFEAVNRDRGADLTGPSRGRR